MIELCYNGVRGKENKKNVIFLTIWSGNTRPQNAQDLSLERW